MNAEVVYYQSTPNFPSWTSPVRSRSPAFRFNSFALSQFLPSVSFQNGSPEPLYGGGSFDGNTYVLGHHQNNDSWVLESFRSEERGVVTTDSDAASTPNGAE